MPARRSAVTGLRVIVVVALLAALTPGPAPAQGAFPAAALLTDINPGPTYAPGGPVSLLSFGGTLYLTADDANHAYRGADLWRSDGITTGTHLPLARQC
ncbi:MAG: hypothetical protein ACYC5O_03020 [Anaerolineae bacterium]